MGIGEATRVGPVASIEQVQEKTPLAPIIKHTISIDSTIQNLYGHPRLSLDIHDNGTCQAIGIYEARDLLEAIPEALNIFEKGSTQKATLVESLHAICKQACLVYKRRKSGMFGLWRTKSDKEDFANVAYATAYLSEQSASQMPHLETLTSLGNLKNQVDEIDGGMLRWFKKGSMDTQGTARTKNNIQAQIRAYDILVSTESKIEEGHKKIIEEHISTLKNLVVRLEKYEKFLTKETSKMANRQVSGSDVSARIKGDEQLRFLNKISKELKESPDKAIEFF